MRIKFILIVYMLISSVKVTIADTIHFQTKDALLKYNNLSTDSIISSINTTINEGKNIIVLDCTNEKQRPTILDKLLDNLNVLFGVIIGAIVTFLISILQDERRKHKAQKKYDRLLNRYILYLSVQERCIQKDENYKLLFPISGEFAEVIITRETNEKLFETIEAIDQFDKDQNAAQFKIAIKKIWNL